MLVECVLPCIGDTKVILEHVDRVEGENPRVLLFLLLLQSSVHQEVFKPHPGTVRRVSILLSQHNATYFYECSHIKLVFLNIGKPEFLILENIKIQP